MFDLNQEIRLWCESVHNRGWRRGAKVAELEDHLHCAVERSLKEGLSEEEAFLAATECLGGLADLRLENLKNRQLLSILLECLMAGSLITGDEDMSNGSLAPRRPLLPTFTMAVGILVGGLVGAALGVWSGSESVTIASYVGGFLAGAVAGALLGWRLHTRLREPSQSNRKIL